MDSYKDLEPGDLFAVSVRPDGECPARYAVTVNIVAAEMRMNDVRVVMVRVMVIEVRVHKWHAQSADRRESAQSGGNEPAQHISNSSRNAAQSQHPGL